MDSKMSDVVTTRSNSNESYTWTGYVTVSRSYATNGLNQYKMAT